MANIRQLVKEHELLDVSVGRDPAGEVALEGGDGALQHPGQVAAGQTDGHIWTFLTP